VLHLYLLQNGRCKVGFLTSSANGAFCFRNHCCKFLFDVAGRWNLIHFYVVMCRIIYSRQQNFAQISPSTISRICFRSSYSDNTLQPDEISM
jgi:hypothetical protein